MSVNEMALKSLERAVLFEHIVDMGLLIMDAAGIREGQTYMAKRIEENPDLLNDEIIKGFYTDLTL